MLKFLLILFLIGYVVFKGIGFFIRMILGGSSMHQYSHQTQNRNNNDQVKVDYVPKEKNNKKDFKGGEYVDFEEVE